MLGALWWTCALCALAAAHVYERCELARELLSLGISQEHLSTWVCIAYHESRFDTSAQNYNSGDHGLLQISQLYWCGAGKACGVSCASLRDEDISNDVKCALRIYEEHTRIQGDGFMAWVVYPLYCKQNNKKFLVGCEDSLKNSSVKPVEKLRSHVNNQPTNAPSYLSVPSIIRGEYDNKVISDDETNWLDYKFENVDDLVLPKEIKKTHISESDKTNQQVFKKSDKVPGYLGIASILQSHFESTEKQSIDKAEQNNWANVIFENIDELTLPEILPNRNSIIKTNLGKNNNQIMLVANKISPQSVSQTLPNYLKINQLVQDNFGEQNEDDDESKDRTPFEVEDIDKLVVPSKVVKTNNLGSVFNEKKKIFKTATYNNEIRRKTHNDPPFLAVAALFQNGQKQENVEKIDTDIHNVNIQEIEESQLFSKDIDRGPSPTILTATKKISNPILQNSRTVTQNLPPYLNIVRRIYPNDQQNDILGTSRTNLESGTFYVKSEPMESRKEIETNKRRHKHHKTSFHTSTTPEILTTNKPPPPAKPSRIIESNQFRHKIPTKTTSYNELELTSASKSSTSTYIPKINIVTNSPVAAAGVSTSKWRPVSSEESINKLNVPNASSWMTDVQPTTIFKSTTNYNTPSTRSTQSVFDIYLNSQTKSTTPWPKFWSWPGASSTSEAKAERISYPSTLKPWSSSRKSEVIKLSSQETTTTARPWLSFSSTTANPRKVYPRENITNGSLSVNTRTSAVWASRRYTTPSDQIEIITTPKTTTTTIYHSRLDQNRDAMISGSSSDRLETIISKSTENNSANRFSFSLRPWSWSTNEQAQSTTPTVPKVLNSIEPTMSTSNPWAWSWRSTQQTSTNSPKPVVSTWPRYKFSTMKSWSWDVNRTTTEKNEEQTVASRYPLNFSTSRPWRWSNAIPTSQKIQTVSSTASLPQMFSTQESPKTERAFVTMKTNKTGLTWNSSNSFPQWSPITITEKPQSNITEIPNITNSRSTSIFSTRRPWSRVSSTTTANPISASNKFRDLNVSTTKALLETWKTESKKSNSSLDSVGDINLSTTVSSRQSLFDLYLSNFGRTPIKRS